MHMLNIGLQWSSKHNGKHIGTSPVCETYQEKRIKNAVDIYSTYDITKSVTITGGF